jgi:Trypsin
VLLKRKALGLLAAAIILGTVLACSGIALAITYGTDDANKHPAVGALVDNTGAYCSGTLVPGKPSGPSKGAPVFLTAAHCTPSGGSAVDVTFDSTYNANSSSTYSGTFYADNANKKGHDIAVVVFDNPPKGPTAQLPTQDSLSNLPRGQQFTAVGYGSTSGKASDYGVRRYAVDDIQTT